jgi:mannose-6-phosphate isomerase-like protein (cupin superfamily)
MRNVFVYAGIAATFFAGGLIAGQIIPPATAQGAPPVLPTQVVNLIAMTDEEIGPLAPNGDVRSRLLGATEHGTVTVQSGNVLKHYHADANEVQYIIDGSGSFWLGDKEIQIKPGDLIMIPKGTVHAGSKATTGRYRAIAFKMPPQRSDDTKRVD